jgi:hypothetical protein
MKTAVVYYSWSGHTRLHAQARAKSEGAELYEIKDEKKPNALKAFTVGAFAAMGMKRTRTQPFTAPLGEFKHIIIMAPVWAGHPAPAINTVFNALPTGKEVTVCMVSGSGRSSSSSRAKIEALITERGCTLTEFEDIKG